MAASTPVPGRSRWIRRGVGRNVIALGLVSLFTDIGSEMLYAVVPLYLTTVLAAPMSVIGLIEGVAESTASLLKLASGWLSDRLGRRMPFVAAGYGLSSASRPLLALATTWPLVLAIRVIDRTGKGLRGPARDALIAESTAPEHRGVAFGTHRALDTAGAVVGPLIALAGLSWWGLGYRGVFWLACVPAVGAMLCLFAVRPPAPRQSTALWAEPHADSETDAVPAVRPGAGAGARAEAGTAGARPRLDPALRRYLAITALFSIGNSSNVFVLLRARDLGWSETGVLGLYVVYNMIYALASTPAGRLSDRIGRRSVLVGGYITFAAVYAGLAMATSPYQVAALFALYGLYSAATGGAGRALVADLSEDANRGRAMGAYQAVSGAILLIASPLAGALWTRFGAAAPFWFGATTALTAALAFVLSRPEAHLADAPATEPAHERAGQQKSGGSDGI